MIERIAALLKQLIGLDAESIGWPVLQQLVQQRIKALGLSDESEYWQHLSTSAVEQQMLIEAAVVPETWFFRYPESFAALVGLAWQRQLQLGGQRPLRLLSVPCSTGEEPYSMVMALLDAGMVSASFEVVGLDISAKALELARQGVYRQNAFRGKALGFRERYFTATDGGFQLHETVLNQVRWVSGNVLAPGVLAGEAAFDFIFCRNLLIYFDRPTQRQALQRLQPLLHDEGCFFVGPAEASLLTQGGWQALAESLTFAFHRPVAVLPAKRSPSLGKPAPVRGADKTPQPRLRAAAPAIAKPAPPVQANKAVVALARLVELADAGRREEAWQACMDYLRDFDANAEVFYWAGLLSDMAGESDKAQDYYRKALYLEPEHVASLVHLATLLAAQGDQAGALRFQQRATRAAQQEVKRDGR